jgi:carnosine N-methyltransferase
MTNEDQTEAITFPDIDTSTIPENVQFSMAAGDFLEVYQDPGLFVCLIGFYVTPTQ